MVTLYCLRCSGIVGFLDLPATYHEGQAKAADEKPWLVGRFGRVLTRDQTENIKMNCPSCGRKVRISPRGAARNMRRGMPWCGR